MPVERLVPYRKISPRRLSDLPGPRRKKPSVRAQTRALRTAIEREHQIVQTLVTDRISRTRYLESLGMPFDPILVWNDFDQTYQFTETNTDLLPDWEELTEHMKLQVGFMAAQTFNGFSFTSHIHPIHLDNWIAKGTVAARTEARLRENLHWAGVPNIPFAYVIEARSRSTKSRTKPHLHGYVIPDKRIDITRFKVGVEHALHHARNETPLRSSWAWHQEDAYDRDTGDGRGFGRWPSYITKAVTRYDDRLRGRRVFFSRSLTQLASQFWALLQEKPL